MADSASEKLKRDRERHSSESSTKNSIKLSTKPKPLDQSMTSAEIDLARSATIKEKKIGHRRVDLYGQTTYKKTSTSTLMAAIQLGIGHSVGGLSAKKDQRERDVLLQDFTVVESVFFPSEGSNITPAHTYPEFRFKTYAPIAFRYFRQLFGIQPDDFLVSLVDRPLTELSNAGASGSIFYLTLDDEFIIKTTQHKESEFLQKLLPGYYMNLVQNPRTLLPKFFGLYTYQSGGKNIRFVIMNNLLPSTMKMHQKFDLKGSTYKRKASKYERSKKSPTLKDLDFVDEHPDGLHLDALTYNALLKTIQRDCRVLESFKIMDYSLLLGIHNMDQAKRDEAKEGKEPSTPGPEDVLPEYPGDVPETPKTPTETTGEDPPNMSSGLPPKLERSRSYNNRQKLAAFSTTREAIQGQSDTHVLGGDDEQSGGIPAKNAKGESLLLFIGIIDILQCYKLKKKLEHTWKAVVHDGDTVSVHRPSFYAQRFQEFMAKSVFKKIPLKHSPSKRRGQAGMYGQSVKAQSEGSTNRPRASTEPVLDQTPKKSAPTELSGARPKEPRPDLVPSTPPLGGEASGYVASAKASKESNENGESGETSPAKTAFRLTPAVTSSDDQTTENNTLAMQELEKKLAAAQIEHSVDLTQSGSSTWDPNSAESSPHKTASDPGLDSPYHHEEYPRILAQGNADMAEYETSAGDNNAKMDHEIQRSGDSAKGFVGDVTLSIGDIKVAVGDRDVNGDDNERNAMTVNERTVESDWKVKDDGMKTKEDVEIDEDFGSVWL